MSFDEQVAQHYGRPSLEQAILQALTTSGKDIDRLAPDDLAPVDEFHVGGREATIDFAEALAPSRGSRLLDIGSGIGGPSRYFAQTRQCRVTGIDLTDEYVRVATALAKRTGLDNLVSYEQGNATSLPVDAGTFDAAYLIHVGMNIENKAALCASVRRALRPGGLFGIYDVMREREGELRFPVPWASTPAVSFVDTPATYRAQLEQAGFVILKQRSRRDFAIEFFRRLQARAAQQGPDPLGLQLLMGTDYSTKVGNMIANLQEGLLSPVEIVAQRRD
jgi:SAM-dependent methyltransferase